MLSGQGQRKRTPESCRWSFRWRLTALNGQGRLRFLLVQGKQRVAQSPIVRRRNESVVNDWVNLTEESYRYRKRNTNNLQKTTIVVNCWRRLSMKVKIVLILIQIFQKHIQNVLIIIIRCLYEEVQRRFLRWWFNWMNNRLIFTAKVLYMNFKVLIADLVFVVKCSGNQVIWL